MGVHVVQDTRARRRSLSRGGSREQNNMSKTTTTKTAYLELGLAHEELFGKIECIHRYKQIFQQKASKRGHKREPVRTENNINFRR